eukprot:6188454-Pleurochrysis_carterae.AAC.2
MSGCLRRGQFLITLEHRCCLLESAILFGFRAYQSACRAPALHTRRLSRVVRRAVCRPQALEALWASGERGAGGFVVANDSVRSRCAMLLR